ncbi:MAG: hypothetical protein K0A92_07545 [Methyloprofundus sp.]|nr:hypothetical protein [Methyloprofundus sp.]
MLRKRPCRICRKWFRPHPRAGNRQKVCSNPACQKERHRRSCATWNKRESKELKKFRMVKRIQISPDEKIEQKLLPTQKIIWSGVQDAVGLQLAVIIEETARLIENWTQDTVWPQLLEIYEKTDKLIKNNTQDDIANTS